MAETRLYIIAPHKNIAGCSEDSRCVSFTTFLQNTSKYLSSNTTVNFYPGLYKIEHSSSNQNVSRYSIDVIGQTNVSVGTHRVSLETDSKLRAEIHCKQMFKVTWAIIQSKNVHIQNIAMIECSASVINRENQARNILIGTICTFVWKLIETETTFLIVKVTNITLTNIQASSSNGTVLLAVHVEEGLSIVSSKLNGTVQVCYPEQLTLKRNTTLQVKNSQIIPAIRYTSQQVYQEGLVIQLASSKRYKMILEIKNTSFYGHSGVYGFTLAVTYDRCSLFTVNLSHLYLLYGGISVSWYEHNTCDECFARNIVSMKSSYLNKLCLGCGVQVIGKRDIDNCLSFKLSNSTISNSRNGLRLLQTLAYISDTRFTNNTNALSVEKSKLVLLGRDTFAKNYELHKDFNAILLRESTAHFRGQILIMNNIGKKYAAFVAHNSTLYFESDCWVQFYQNQGYYGGALSLYTYSVLNVMPTANVTFINNNARKNGGAIYVDTLSYESPNIELHHQCFYYGYRRQTENMYFCNNTAVQGGDSIYGGSIDKCYGRKSTTARHSEFDLHNNNQNLDDITLFCNSSDSSSVISSNPIRLCFCSNSNIYCDSVEQNVTAVPGQTIELSVVAVGQRYGITLATVQSRLMIPYAAIPNMIYPHISELQTRQQAYRTCTKLQYTVYAPAGDQKMLLATKDISDEEALNNLESFKKLFGSNLPELVQFSLEVPLIIQLSLLDCSLGFIFNQTTLECVCHLYLEHGGIQCIIRNQAIQRSGTVWVNATNNTIIIHKHCPLGYCNTGPMELSLTTPSDQCSFDRSGTLCGECRGNLSQVLGSLDCKECSNFWLFLVIPLTVVSGIILVLFLMILNLTVSTGAINGLIFYANIVRANNAIYFNSQTLTITSISSVFIAWINLDLGIEVCFYDGLDAYAKTLFQLAFPLYICAIVVIIIVSSHYSTIAAKLSGRNAVQVLATLFLLSYSKMIRLVITTLSFTEITIQHYPNDTNTSRIVWLYDGNVDYLQGKHIALFLIGILILVLVSLPYTTILIFTQCLERISHYKGMSWVWKIKPLLDAYTGPYKNKHRYWTGLLLLVRVVLYAIFSLNFAGDPAINLLAMCITMLLILAYIAVIGRVYKSKSLNILECTFLLNLAILSASTLFALHTNRNQEVVINISVILTFVLFCVILVQHMYKRIKATRLFKRYKDRLKKREKTFRKSIRKQEEESTQESTVTRQVVCVNDLNEPLIEIPNK